MSIATFGYSVLVLLALIWSVKTADNDIRIVLNAISATEGRIEVSYNVSWGPVCDDSWGMRETNVACRQLGYKSAVNEWSTTGPTNYILDNVQCPLPEQFRLQDCNHNGIGRHNCGAPQNVAVSCSGGVRETVSNLILRADLYWNCDYFVTGESYNIKSGKNAAVYGAASFAKSPINSGFRLQSKLSWVNLGDFSDDECLKDPSTCNLVVSVWLRISRKNRHITYILGNQYDQTKPRGFSIYQLYDTQLRGYVIGSEKHCWFWHFYFTIGYWFHFSLEWPPRANNWFAFKNGQKVGKSGCGSPNRRDVNLTNPVYTLGADVLRAGDANRNLDVAFDELFFWYSPVSDEEKQASKHLASDIGGVSINELTLTLSQIAWNTAYNDMSSEYYIDLHNAIKSQLDELYRGYSYNSVKVKNLRDNDGVLQMSLQLNYSAVRWEHAYYLQKSFFDGTFINSTAEILDCKSTFEFCTTPILQSVTSDHTGHNIYVSFLPPANHSRDALFLGYYIRVRQVNGSGAYGNHHYSNSPREQRTHVKVIPISNFSVTIMPRSHKGYGFRCSNFMYGQTIEASPDTRPSYIAVQDLTPWNLTFVWGTIDTTYGVIRGYLVRLHNTTGQMEDVYVNASYERKVHFGGLLPNQKYYIWVGGYTSHPSLGALNSTAWFRSRALLPSKPPRDFEVYFVGSSFVVLEWRSVIPSGRNGHVILYHIRFRNLRTTAIEVTRNYTITDESRQKYVAWFFNLGGLTTYSVNISLLNNVGYGPIANLVFSTLEGVPSRAPENFTILNMTADSIFLGWFSLAVDHLNGVLRGYRVYYRLANLPHPWRNMTVSNLTATVPVLSLRRYELKLCAFTAVGNGKLTAIAEAFVPGFAPLNLASDVNVVRLTNDSMLLEWRYSTTHGRPAHYFIITATRNDTNKTEVQEVFDVVRWSNQVYQYTIKNLKQFKWYKIHIAAGNLKGNASFIDDPPVNRTLEGVPSASPRNLTATNTSSTSMLLQWKPVLYEYANGIIRGYYVYWRLHQIYISTQWHSFQVNGSMNTSTVVQNLEKFKDYEFKVSAFNSIRESIKTIPVVARTDEDVPGHPPLNIITHNTSSRSLNVSWQPPPADWQFGIIRGYRVIIMDTRDGNTSVHDVPRRANSFEKEGLERYTNYSITVAGSTIKGLGNFSQPIIVITDEDVPSEGPPNIICTNTSSRNLSITWSVLPVSKAHGIVTSYKVLLQRSDGRENTSLDIQPSVSRSTDFPGLDEYVEYTVTILATTIKGEGNRSDPVTCLTDQDIPHNSPQGLYGYNTSDTSIKVFWQDVPTDDQNGIILGYKLFYNTTLRTGEIVKHSKRLDTRMEDDLIGLLPFKIYSIRVAAFTSKGLGPTSEPVLISTDEEAPKFPPGDVKAFNTSSTSIRLTWQAIPPETVGGIVRGYVIRWEEVNYKGKVILQNQTRLNNASITSLDFNGLTKYQEYRFRILAFTKYEGVFSSPVSTMTDQDIPTAPPSNCSGFNISKNEIKVLWDVVHRRERNGIILGYRIYSNKTFSYFSLMPPDYVEAYQPTLVKTIGSRSRSFVWDGLLPYTDYTFQVVAFTSKGEGPKCEHFTLRTEEEAPLYSPANLAVFNTSSTSLNVSWSGLSLSIIRGVFVGYDIFFTAYPQFPDAYLTYGHQEAKRRRRAVFTVDRQTASVGVTEETTQITGLAKYTNYSIQVMGLTKFVGAQSVILQLLTDEDKPGKTPRNFRGHNLTSSSLRLQWSPVQDGFVHGILLGYRIYYRVTNMPLMPLVNVTYDPSTLEWSFHGLLMFTNYTLQITAFTSKGEGPYTNELVICTDEDVASKSPFGFKVVTLYRTHEIPMTWRPVPNGFLNGILTGYRLKMRQISEAMEDVDGREIHIEFDPDTLNYTARNLPNFATYTFQIVAVTKYGEGVHSPVLIGKTCPCEKNLTTNWTPLPPYTNKTDDNEAGIFPWLLDNLVTDCCRNCYNGHGWSEIFYNIDGKGGDGFKYSISSFKTNIDDDTDFHFPVEGTTLQDRYATYYSYVFAVASPGVAFFIVDDPPDKMPNAILETVTSSWSLLFFATIFSMASGIVLWFLDTATNETEFPRTFYKGAGEGFWWAFISMTTVGYGDRSPRSFLARLFAMFWILTGLVLTSILMSAITNALTTVTFDSKSIKLYGTKVAAIEGSPSYRVGIRRNALVNPDHEYNDAFEIQADLLKRNVKGALMDGYMAGSYHELFEDEHVRVKEIIDYKSGYGIVLGGQSFRLQKCFKNYVKRKRSYIIDHVAKEVKAVKKNPKSLAEAQSTKLFNPEAKIFVISMSAVLGLYVLAIIAGLCLHVYFKRRFRNKVDHASEAYDKRISKEFSELLESFQTRMSSLKEELYNKHTNELRMLSGIKRRSVKYDILLQLREESENDYGRITIPGTPIEISLEKLNSELESTTTEQSDGELPIRPPLQSPLTATSTASLLSDSFHEIELRDTVESKPNIADLQREAYLAGLRGPRSHELGHPYTKMYRYLWVEEGIGSGGC